MAILAGDRLGGVAGSAAAMLGMCLPAFVFMTLAGIIYGQNHGRPIVDAMLRGVAAAATGLLASTWFQIGRKSVKGFYEAFFVLAAILGINYFKLGVPLTLLLDGALAIFVFRPRAPVPTPSQEDEQWIKSLQ
jgi:chromate transporter